MGDEHEDVAAVKVGKVGGGMANFDSKSDDGLVWDVTEGTSGIGRRLTERIGGAGATDIYDLFVHTSFRKQQSSYKRQVNADW